MHDEAHEERQQSTMPYLTTPTRTANVHEARSRRSEPTAITIAVGEPAPEPFILGTDTCGFITGSTYSYRGCCAAGALDCTATIYTGCLDYQDMPNAAMCGPQTLCCPWSRAYCVTHGFMTEGQPGATFTHVRCAESPVAGDLYPYPPEGITTIADSTTDSISSIPTVEPSASGGSSSSKPVSPGTIAAAAVGGAVFVLLAILGILFYIIKKRRQQRQTSRISICVNDAPIESTGDVDFGSKRPIERQSSLSTIHEQQTPVSPSPSLVSKRRSVSSLFRRQNWPLGAGAPPISPRYPLSSHPILDLEKRASLSERPPQPSSYHLGSGGALLRASTPISEPCSTPPLMSTGTESRDPRVSFIPTPTIDTAFGRELEWTLNGVGGTFYNTGGRSSNLTDDREPVCPTSPLGGTQGNKRASFVSALSIPRDRGQGEANSLVSPVSPNSTEGRVSPMTVSPLESRRGSFDP
ncbi:hypothetical protein F4802DRAFT_615291 [Xylaria palmicola]|nr:hypothetical protein F4802DRAFT_615291 [Xylaria palmicola]